MTEPLDSFRVPLSAPGSLYGVSAETRVDPHRWHVRTLHRFAEPRELWALGIAGCMQAQDAVLDPGQVALQFPGGTVRAAFESAKVLRLEFAGGPGDVQASTPDGRIGANEGGFELVEPTLGIHHRVSVRSGAAELVNGRALRVKSIAGGAAELVLAEKSARETGGERRFDEIVAGRRRQFSRWLDSWIALLPEADRGALIEAAYLFWAFQAGPEGALQRRALFMSKNWMTAIWSWDNFFNAVAVAPVDPELAWDQFCFFFDHQDERGRCPDFIAAAGVNWGRQKPPVAGWALRQLRRTGEVFRDPDRWREAYGPMARQVEGWLKHGDSDGDGLPEYGHGCDSGWDNGTGFQVTPCASPDLAAWLIIQCEELAELAAGLGIPNESDRWRAEADRLTTVMRAACWRDGAWRVFAPSRQKPAPPGDSLLPWLAGMVGYRMTGEERRAVRDALGDPSRFLAPAGPATESLASPLYEEDGYWRGPVWGPSTVMAVEAALACGGDVLAREIARRFIAVGSAHGFAENHHAKTGRGLRDPAYTWTAAAWAHLQRTPLLEGAPEARLS